MTRKSARPTDVNAYRVTASPDNKPPQTNWSMDNNAYEMTDQPKDSQLSSLPQDLASPYSIPIKLKEINAENCESVELEGFYDLAASEDNSTDDGGDYSVLNHSKSGRATCSIELSEVTNESGSRSCFPSNGMPLEMDSVYQTLNNDEEDFMYSSVK